MMINLQSFDIWQQISIIVSAVIAAVLGSLIGWERDKAGKSAGPRTMALVGSACAAIVAIGAAVGADAQFGDPTRALHAVVTGIGFLGAGLIFTDKHATSIQGVTTAATVYITAAVGIAVGLGFYFVGVGLTLIVLIVLRSTHFLEISFNRSNS